MASNARCLFFFFFLLALSFSLQTHARDSKLFNKLTKNTKEDSITVSHVQASPSPSPLPEFKAVEHGYGLYGQDPNENPPTTTQFGEEFSKQSNNNFNDEKQGMSDTRFLEKGKYFFDVSKDENRGNGYGYENGNGIGNQEKQGLSDTRFLENGKYSYDVNNEEESTATPFYNTNNYENENENFEGEKPGMSDTRFLENGKYFYDVNNEEKEANEEGSFGEFNVNKENENENGKGKFETEKQGMSDTRFLENGKYWYDVNNEKENNNHEYGDVGFHNKDNIEYANSYNGYETQGRGGYNNNNNNHHNGRGGYNYPNKFPKYEYDTMEEYDRQQGYVVGNKDEYVP